MRRPVYLPLLVLACVTPPRNGPSEAENTLPRDAGFGSLATVPQPPVAKRVPKTSTLHGETRVDDFFWLRQKTNPEVLAYLQAENAYTDTILRSTEPLQEQLYQEMLGRIQETDVSAPYPIGNYLYYQRT